MLNSARLEPANVRAALAPLLLVIALVLSMWFQGFEVAIFSVTLALLVSSLLLVVWQARKRELRFPVSPLVIALMLFWLWLVLSLAWTRVWYVSVFDVWTTSALTVTFWTYLLMPGRERVWPVLALAALAAGVGLAAVGIYEFFFVPGRAPCATFLNVNSYSALLNLVALPVAAAMLDAAAEGRRRRQRLLGVALLVLSFAVAVNAGRAAGITLAMGLVIVMAAGVGRLRGCALATPAAIVAAAYALAYWSSHGVLARKFAELSAPLTASSMADRLQIWSATWHMIQEAPWWGIGPGLFTLAYPAYRIPAESSAGYFVHNDYLQLLLEGGVPGLLLLLLVMGAATRCFFRVLRRPLSSAQRYEAVGIFAALVAVAVHAAVDFNFHVLTILMLLGLMLARLQVLACTVGACRTVVVPVGRWLSPAGYRAITGLLAALAFLYLFSILIAIKETDRAEKLVSQGELQQADTALERAYAFYAEADNVPVMYADFYRYVLSLTPRNRIEERRELFSRAKKLLDDAARKNPYRALNDLVRAQLYAQNPDLLGVAAAAAAESAYQHALAINPRFYNARFAYARYELAAGRRARAREILEAGMSQYYPAATDVAPYLMFTARLRSVDGDASGAEQLRERAAELLSRLPSRRIPLPEGAHPFARATTSAPLPEVR
jgi:O-antigen ligase